MPLVKSSLILLVYEFLMQDLELVLNITFAHKLEIGWMTGARYSFLKDPSTRFGFYYAMGVATWQKDRQG